MMGEFGTTREGGGDEDGLAETGYNVRGLSSIDSGLFLV